MRRRIRTYLLAVALAAVAPALGADVWDEGTDNDNDQGTDNELVHGLDQVHDMAAQQSGTVEDVDWYRIEVVCNSSYEVVVDGFTGDLADLASPTIEWLDEDHTTVLGTATSVSAFGVARRMGMIGPHCIPASYSEHANYIRVRAPRCGLNCSANDRYHIRFYDTTALLPRFNNTSGQVTVLILQNSTDRPVSGHATAYDAAGAIITYIGITMVPNEVRVLNLSTFMDNKSGALTIQNDAPYGALAGKAVALEPSTGFTFDTPLVYKPH